MAAPAPGGGPSLPLYYFRPASARKATTFYPYLHAGQPDPTISNVETAPQAAQACRAHRLPVMTKFTESIFLLAWENGSLHNMCARFFLACALIGFCHGQTSYQAATATGGLNPVAKNSAGQNYCTAQTYSYSGAASVSGTACVAAPSWCTSFSPSSPLKPFPLLSYYSMPPSSSSCRRPRPFP